MSDGAFLALARFLTWGLPLIVGFLAIWALTGETPVDVYRDIADGVHLFARLYDPIAR